MKRKILIACIALLSAVLLGCLLFIVKMEYQLTGSSETVPTGETGSGNTVQGTDSSSTAETTVVPESTTTLTETPIQTQPKETAPPVTTKPSETTVPTRRTEPTKNTASSDDKLDEDELPVIPD